MADDITINIVDNPVNVTIGLSTTPDNFQVSTFPGAAIWGNIIGTLSNQTDLWRYLSAETFSPSQLTAFLNTNAISLCSIDVNGTILSAGTNLFDIFLTSETDSQTLSYIPSSYNLSISNGNTVNLSSINLAIIPTVTNYLSNNNVQLSGVSLSPITNTQGADVNRLLQDKLSEIISVKDFGAKGDGIANDWNALQAAFNTAASSAKIYIPKGVYIISQELKIPSNSYIYGAGIGTTIIKLSSSADATQCVMTNSQNTRSIVTNQGNENIVIKDLELDGNVSRFPGSYSPVGDTSGTGLCFSNVHNALVERVSVHDTCRHCFDIGAPETSITFNPLDYVPNPSYNVHLKDVIAYGAGDDNITTHFSHNITIENAYVPYTGGTEIPTNSNGIEIDDGCWDITIIGGYIKNCRRGLEVKGHSWAPASKRVQVYGLTCENNVRNFGIRHLGFDNTDSKTAFDVSLYDCTSIAPVSSTQTPDGPRSLQISNYDGVFVKNFRVVGEHNAARAVTIQERARNVVIDGITFTQISGAVTGVTDGLLYIDSTASRNITVRNAIFRDCVGLPIYAEGSIPGIVIDGVDARTSLTTNPPVRVIDFSWSPLDVPYIIRNVTMSGYLSAYQLGGSHSFDYPVPVDVGSITNIIPSSPATVNTQYTVARFGWREGTGQGLNPGIGTKIEFTGSVVSGVSANTNIPIAYIGTRKINSTDSDVTSNLTFGTLSANNAVPVDRLTITSTGNVGINTTAPNERVTVIGNVSSTGVIYASGGDSNLWNSAYTIATTYQNASGSFATNSTVNSVSGLLTPLTVTNTLTSQLLLTTTYQNASGNWQSTFTTVTNNSAYWTGNFKLLASNENILSASNFNVFYKTVSSSNVFTFANFTSGLTITVYFSGNHSIPYRHYFPVNTYLNNIGEANYVYTFPNKITKTVLQSLGNRYFGTTEIIDAAVPSITATNSIMLNGIFGFLLAENRTLLQQEP